MIYTQHGELPETALLASLGCGNPTALAALKDGDTVLDLGSGGGIDLLLAARRFLLEARPYGLDMTDAMLEVAERNRQEAGIENVRFLRGVIEAIRLPTNEVDVVISNCAAAAATSQSQAVSRSSASASKAGKSACSVLTVICRARPAIQMTNAIAAMIRIVPLTTRSPR